MNASPNPAREQQRAAEHWLLYRGLPYVLRPDRLLRNVWARSAPALAANAVSMAFSIITVAITGQFTSCVPRTAASIGGSPRSCRAVMFSATTIASSTSRPSTMINPNIVSRLSVIPAKCIAASVPRMEITRPTATQNATRKFSSRTSVISTSTPPCSAFRESNSNRPTINRARSVVTANSPGSGF